MNVKEARQEAKKRFNGLCCVCPVCDGVVCAGEFPGIGGRRHGVAGSTLPLDHGFPLRVVVPRLLGYKNAKYMERLELADKPLIGYWVAAGYDLAGLVQKNRLRKSHY